MWKSMVWPGSRLISQMRTCSFSSTMRWPTSPSVMPFAAAVLIPVLSVMSAIRVSPCASLRNDGNGVDLDQIVRRGHLGDLDHGRGRQRRLEVLLAHVVDGLEVLHVAHIDIDPADMVEGAAGGLHRCLDVLAHLPGLR